METLPQKNAKQQDLLIVAMMLKDNGGQDA